MQDISVLPGRIRFRNNLLLYNKNLSKYINVYIDNLYGVQYSAVNPSTASILVSYDTRRTSYRVIRQNIVQAVSSAIRNEPENSREYDAYYEILEKRDKAKRKIVFFSLIYAALKIKNSLFGKFFLSTNAGVLQAAAAVTIIGGYPLLKNLYRKFAKNIPADSDILLSLMALAFTLTRESSKGVLLLMLKAANDYIKYAADAQCRRLLNQARNQTSEMVWFVASSGQEILLNADEAAVNDIVALHEGESAAVQGEVTGGSVLVNTLTYNGQAEVTRAARGSRIYPGMSLLSGSLRMKVEKLPEKIRPAEFEEDHTAIRQRVVRYQDFVTPVALSTGGFSYLLSGNAMNAFAVMLALTPSGAATALSTGRNSYVSLLSKNGIYLNRPKTFEKVVCTDHILFDKTGTLTQGRMNLEFIQSFEENFNDRELLKMCAACESEHYHPISITLREEYKGDPDIRRVNGSVLIPSKGVRANYENHTVSIGNKEIPWLPPDAIKSANNPLLINMLFRTLPISVPLSACVF